MTKSTPSTAAPADAMSEGRPNTPQGDSLPFLCDAWSRRVHKCTEQCDGCFRREHEPRLRRAEKLLREFITTCELHRVDSKKFFDLWSDVEAARVYFKEATPVAQSENARITYHGSGEDLATDVYALLDPKQRARFMTKWKERASG